MGQGVTGFSIKSFLYIYVTETFAVWHTDSPFHLECSTMKRPAYLYLGEEGCYSLLKEQLYLKYGVLVLLSTVCRSADTEFNNVKFNLVWFNGVEENCYLYGAELWLCVMPDCGLSLWVKIRQVFIFIIEEQIFL